jgi:2,4-diketo-3-deoxy-L-fuconate hydrolase
MRFGTLAGRLVLATSTTDESAEVVDVAVASGGRFGPDPASAFADWDGILAWADGFLPTGRTPIRFEELGPPVPAPPQVFAVGLNYRDRADEGGITDVPTPPIFTKFPSCLVGPAAQIALPTATVDWEAELVVVIGRQAREVSPDKAWAYVAGVMIGQDITERTSQFRPPVPQFGLSKSHPGFGPTGPWLVTPDELADRDDLAVECRVNDEIVQQGRTSAMLVPVPQLVSRLSAVVTLLPGDLIFTGTPGGVGHHREPPRYLAAGDRLSTTITGLGRQQLTFGPPE